MEEEIDQVFIGTADMLADEEQIRRLKECGDALPALHPYLDLLIDDTRELRNHYSLYNVRLGCLDQELRAIQKKNNELEAHNARETAIYEALKSLYLALSVDEAHFDTLEKGSFDTPEGLARLEASLEIIGAIDLEKYTVRVVRERRDEILRAQRGFLKRFVAHLDQLRISSESRGELRVHRGLYKVFERYRFIYQFAKRFDDYNALVCNAYEAHSKQMYDREIENYLGSMTRLANSPQKLSCAIEMLMHSYESLMACECGARRTMGAEFSLDRIFKDTNAAIIEFIGQLFKKSQHATLVATGIALNAEKSQLAEYEAFRTELRRKYTVLEDLFIKKQKECSVDRESIRWLNVIQAANCIDTLKEQLFRLCIRKLSMPDDREDAKAVLLKLQLLHCIEKQNDLTKRAVEKVSAKLPQVITEFVFANHDECINAKELTKSLDKQCPAYNQLLETTIKIIFSNADDSLKQKLKEILSESD